MKTRKHEIHGVQHTRKQAIQEHKEYKKTRNTRAHEIQENKKYKKTRHTRKHEHTRKQDIQELVKQHNFTLYSTYMNICSNVTISAQYLA